jgi:hypothetical protein
MRLSVDWINFLLTLGIFFLMGGKDGDKTYIEDSTDIFFDKISNAVHKAS